MSGGQVPCEHSGRGDVARREEYSRKKEVGKGPGLALAEEKCQGKRWAVAVFPPKKL